MIKENVQIEVLDDGGIKLNGEVYQPVKKSAVWVPKDGEQCAALGMAYEPLMVNFNDAYQVDYQVGALFKTIEEAELKAKRDKLIKRYEDLIAEYNDGWWPDWKSDEQSKHFIMVNEGDIGWNWYTTIQHQPSSWYFKGVGCFEKIKEELTDSEIKLIITGEE